jgi:hypothetical protein
MAVVHTIVGGRIVYSSGKALAGETTAR